MKPISFLQPTGPQYAPGPLDNAEITENWVHDNVQGIGLVNGQNCIVSEHLAENNHRYGIALFTTSSGNSISENVVTGTTEFFGIGLAWSLNYEPIPGPIGNVISENIATGNGAFDLLHTGLCSPNEWRENVYETKSGGDIP